MNDEHTPHVAVTLPESVAEWLCEGLRVDAKFHAYWAEAAPDAARRHKHAMIAKAYADAEAKLREAETIHA